MCCVIHLAGSQESVHIEQEDHLRKFHDMEPAGKEGIYIAFRYSRCIVKYLLHTLKGKSGEKSPPIFIALKHPPTSA